MNGSTQSVHCKGIPITTSVVYPQFRWSTKEVTHFFIEKIKDAIPHLHGTLILLSDAFHKIKLTDNRGSPPPTHVTHVNV